MRIAVFFFAHETVTFLPTDTVFDDFVYPGSPASGDALLREETDRYLGGFVQVASEHADVELIGITSPLFPRTGTGTGWITNEAYEHFVTTMERELAEQGPFDGAYLSLHGAMAVRGVPKPEADIARRVRAIIGEKAFISATFDPHGNEDEDFLHYADFSFCVRYYPHYDMHLQGERAARMLIRAIRGEYHPTTATVRVPIISPTVVQATSVSPWSDLVQRCLVAEARETDLYINVFYGFPWSDVPDAGMCVQVMTNNNPERARAVAKDMAEWLWRKREDLLNTTTIHRISEGVALAKQDVAEGRGPIVLADYSDRSGSATWLLSEIVEQKLSRVLVATIASKNIVDAALAGEIKPGHDVELAVGGLADDSAGPPALVRGKLVRVATATHHRNEPWVLVAFGEGNMLIVSSYLTQILEPEELWDTGLDAKDYDYVVLKSRVHFRRGFEDSGYAPISYLLEPNEPYLGTVKLDALTYENLDLTKFYPYGNVEFTCEIHPGRLG